MEHFLQHRTGKPIRETNITEWRRTVCGDLTAVFSPYNGESMAVPAFPAKDIFYESVHKAQFKKDPYGYRPLTAAEVTAVNHAGKHELMAEQEKGIRPAAALPYELLVDGQLDGAGRKFRLQMTAGSTVFGNRSAGAPFTVRLRQWRNLNHPVLCSSAR